jgi:23S rRNA G2445 N2-methylase RlmL
MGSGTELIERARVGPYRMLIGSDLDLDAVDVARRNAAAAGVDRLILQVADATSHRPAGVTRIITNPPMGRRVARDGSLGDLCDQFTDHAATVLSSGGRLTWLSPLGGRTAARAEANRLRVLCRRVVDMGGFFAELQVWLKS